MTSNINKNIDIVKTIIPIILTVVTSTIAAIFWVQGYVNSNCYAKISGQNLEDQIQEIKQDIRTIRQQNDEILISLSKRSAK